MKSEELRQQYHFIIIGVLMTIISLVFLLYMGSSLVAATKSYKGQTVEMTIIDK